VGAAQPKPENAADKQAAGNEKALVRGVEQAIGNALVPHQDEIKEWGETHRLARANVIDIKHPPFVGLVDGENEQCQGKT
jgi:hypothetical protein